MFEKIFQARSRDIFEKEEGINLEASSNETVAFLIAIKLEKLMEQRDGG